MEKSFAVLIPIYNREVTQLVLNLVNQKSNQEFKIFCVDDVSDNKIKIRNQDILKIKNVDYTELTEKLSRSQIRNYLANKAKNYDFLIFIDDDAQLITTDFIQKYIDNCLENPHAVYCGGMMKPSSYLKQKNNILAWKYDYYIQSQNENYRTKSNFLSLKSFNFCISSELFFRFPFSEKISNYGHEDTFFAYELFKNNIPIIPINNPLLHTGIESNSIFIEKAEISIPNLVLFEDKHQDFLNNITLWKAKNKFQILYNLFPKLFNFINSKIKKHLLESKNPNLKLFNIYKLLYLCKLKK